MEDTLYIWIGKAGSRWSAFMSCQNDLSNGEMVLKMPSRYYYREDAFEGMLRFINDWESDYNFLVVEHPDFVGDYDNQYSVAY
jgi:hypothetical protein